MTDRNFFQLERTLVKKDGRLLEGIFDVWFMDDGLYFLHYFSSKQEFYKNIREQKWGLKPADRLRDNAGSFFVARYEIFERNAHPLHVKLVSAQFGHKVGSYDTHVLNLRTAGGSKLELTADRIKDLLGGLDVYFSGGSVFKAQEYAGHGLEIIFPAPIAFISQVMDKKIEPPLAAKTLEDMATNREYMDRFWTLFASKVPGKKDREVLEYMMDRSPAKFQEEILDHLRKVADPKLAVMAILGIAAVGSTFVSMPSVLKFAAGIIGLFMVLIAAGLKAESRKQTKIRAELIRKFR